MQIYVQHGGQQLGPFTEAELQAQIAAGAVSPQDHVWWQGQANWIPLAQSQFAAPGTSAPPGPGTPAMPASPLGVAAPSSKFAVPALVCGCCSLLCSIFTAIPAIILGHMSLKEIKKNPGMQGGGMALAGLILGYVFTAFGIIYIGVVGLSVLIALGNQVKSVNQNIQSQIQSAESTNSDSSSTDQNSSTSSSSDQSTSTNSDQSTNAPAATSPDQSTNSDQSTNAAPTTPSSGSSTNSADSSKSPADTTNSAPMNQ